MGQSVNQINQGFRKTAAGLKLGKAVFDPSALGSVSPKVISDLLRAAGIPVPKEAIMGVEAAQLVMSGGTFVSGVAAGASIGSLITPALSATTAAINFLSMTGLMDPDAPAAHILNFGTSAALVISSGGLNVLADLAFVANLFGELFSADNRPEIHQKMKTEAHNALAKWWKGVTEPEAAAAAKVFSDFQNKKLSPFQMLGAVAEAAPDLFLNYFPAMKSFVPAITEHSKVTACAEAHHGGFLGIGRTYETVCETATLDHEHVAYLYDRNLYAQFFLDYVQGPFEPYRVISQMPPSTMQIWGYPPKAVAENLLNPHWHAVWPRIRLIDLACFSMLPPYFDYLHDDFDIKKVLRALRLTPYELGYTALLQQQLLFGDYGRQAVKSGGALTINGIAMYSAPQKSANAEADTHNANILKAISADQSGDIDTLLSIPEAVKVITEWGIMPYFPGGDESKLPAGYKNVTLNDPKGYRNIRNYWGAISAMQIARKDPFFNPNDFRAIDLYFPKIESLDARLREIQFRAVAKFMNVQAKNNIASYFGIDPGKLKLSKPMPGKPIVVLN